ncbi:MAG: AI-2E family transporter [Rubrivivax sp.]|nr:MAG: AI-2E family transporter [Rubrivivax sp.]
MTRPAPRNSVAGTVLATLAVIMALWSGQQFIIPLVAGLILSVLVAPVVDTLERFIRSRIAGTVIALTMVVSLLSGAALIFGSQMLRVTDRLPGMISLAAERIADADPAPDSIVSRSREALERLDRAASRLTGITAPRTTPLPTPQRLAPLPPQPIGAVVVDSPLIDSATLALKQTAVTGSSALLRFMSDFAIILFVAFFILIGGQTLVNRFIDQWDEQSTAKLRVDHGMHECARQVRIYAGVLLLTNAIIGLAVWAVFSVSGMPDAAGWGVTAAVLHVVPYMGMALLTCLGAAESFLAHGSWAAGLGMAGFIVVLSTVIGTIVTAWLQGRAAKMNSAAVFIGLVFWGGLWGVWGLFLGPVLVVLFKVAAEHSPSGKGLARLMQG